MGISGMKQKRTDLVKNFLGCLISASLKFMELVLDKLPITVIIKENSLQ